MFNFVKRVGKSDFPAVKKPERANRRNFFMAVKRSRKFPGVVIYSYFKDSAFTAVKGDSTV